MAGSRFIHPQPAFNPHEGVLRGSSDPMLPRLARTRLAEPANASSGVQRVHTLLAPFDGNERHSADEQDLEIGQHQFFVKLGYIHT